MALDFSLLTYAVGLAAAFGGGFIDSIAGAHADLTKRGALDSIHMISYPGVPIYFKKKKIKTFQNVLHKRNQFIYLLE